ncbi:hypothetical protein T12_14438 [Trichinella patagoniensis]|uniref:Uncharacterized protein n=1 Tax=Trichinella patagoniensis TaxID=990121 RepID=A0A0V0Z1Q0_9BILA|nr:hypothetical protein T12_14438 [Trichinella patagoniensis]
MFKIFETDNRFSYIISFLELRVHIYDVKRVLARTRMDDIPMNND